MDLEDYIVHIFCEVDDFMRVFFPARSLRERGPLPELTDSEVLTIEIVGEKMGFETDKKIFKFFKKFYRTFFPKLRGRESFLRQAANLWQVKAVLWRRLTGRYADTLHVVDSLPMHVCRFARAKGSRLFRGIAAYGKELGQQTFYGFRLHLKINSLGMINAFDLTPANVHDVRMVQELAQHDSGVLLGDRGYISQDLQTELQQSQELTLCVPAQQKNPLKLAPTQIRFYKRLRRKIETVGSQLDHYFRIKKIWARDIWHLTNRLYRKILAHTFSVILCLDHNLPPLQFANLLP